VATAVSIHGSGLLCDQGAVVPVLEVTGLTKTFAKLTALDGVSLTIAPGEIFALLGPNGAGKTTLIGAICGLVKKSSGTIRLLGVDLEVDPLSPRRDVGLVPQEINFDPFFTVRESLELQLGYFGRPPDPARIDELLEALALSNKAEQPTRALSGGMKRRLLIAKALVHRPKLVFLDEPTAGVDVELRRDLWSYVRRLRAEGTTVVLTTHYLEEAEELADRVGIIDKGRLLLVEEKRALLKRLGERRLEVHFRAPVTALPSVAATGTLSPDGLSFVFLERAGTPACAEVLGALYAAALPVADVTMTPAKLEDVLLRVLRSGNGAGS
jgi:ABC-2 type transport system ATP-binding protein